MRIAIADDSALFRDGLVALLEKAGLSVVLCVGTGEEILARVPDDPPDVVILDIRMPPTNTDEGLAVAEELKIACPDVGVLVLSAHLETEYAVRVLATGLGGIGYLLKDSVDNIETLVDALTRVAAGGQVLDPLVISRLLDRQRHSHLLATLNDRERDVLRHMAEGRTNAGIGRELHLSPKTIETYVAGVFSKLNIPSGNGDNRRVLAVVAWLRAKPGGSNPIG